MKCGGRGVFWCESKDLDEDSNDSRREDNKTSDPGTAEEMQNDVSVGVGVDITIVAGGDACCVFPP